MLPPRRLSPPHTHLHTNSPKTAREFRFIPPKWLWSQAHSQCGPQTRYVSWKSFRNAVSGLQTRFPRWSLCIVNIQKHCFKDVGCFVWLASKKQATRTCKCLPADIGVNPWCLQDLGLGGRSRSQVQSPQQVRKSVSVLFVKTHRKIFHKNKHL